MLKLTNADGFFATARERERIRQLRAAGQPGPWTTDSVFRTGRFCNVHREHDKTTQWFHQEVRQHLDVHDVVDADPLEGGALLMGRAEHRSAGAAEAVDSDAC